MSISRSVAAIGLLTGLSLVAAPAQAQYYSQSTWITPFGGVYFGGSLDGTASAAFNSIDIGTSFTFGARLGHKFNSSVGLEFEYAHADPSVEVRGGLAAGDNFDLNTNIYEGTFNFYFGNDPNTQGYIALGGGADDFSVTHTDSLGNSTSRGSTQFGGVIGLGGQKFFNEKWGATLDGRYRWVNVNGSDSIYCGYYGCYAYDTSWYGSGEITLGITYKFK